MARTNESIYQILVTKDTAPVVDAGVNVTELNPGQLGIFNYETGLSIDVTKPSTMKRVFLAVGLDPEGLGITTDVMKSAGEHLEVSKIHTIVAQCPSKGQNQILQVQFNNVKGDNEYALKVSFHNETLSKDYGFNFPSKTFTAKTKCCETVNVCSCDDNTVCNDLVVAMYHAVNADSEQVLKAVIWDVVADAEVEVDDVPAWLVLNTEGCLALRIEAFSEGLSKYCQINYNYQFLRQYAIKAFVTNLDKTFTSSATITEVQPLMYALGQGYDVQRMESIAGGWNGKPGVYRQHELVGGPIGNYQLNAERDAEYVLINIDGTIVSVVGNHKEYTNNIETVIAIKCEDFKTVWGTLVDENGLLYLFSEIIKANGLVFDIPEVLGCCEGI